MPTISPSTAGQLPAPASPTPPAAAGGMQSILFVDDEEAVRGLAERVLVDEGYQVLTAGNGREAFDLYRASSQPIHLVITDVSMPGMSGPELIAALTALGHSPRVLYCSGDPGSAVHLPGLFTSPAAAFLEKPFTPDDLVRKVREVLEG